MSDNILPFTIYHLQFSNMLCDRSSVVTTHNIIVCSLCDLLLTVVIFVCEFRSQVDKDGGGR